MPSKAFFILLYLSVSFMELLNLLCFGRYIKKYSFNLSHSIKCTATNLRDNYLVSKCLLTCCPVIFVNFFLFHIILPPSSWQFKKGVHVKMIQTDQNQIKQTDQNQNQALLKLFKIHCVLYENNMDINFKPLHLAPWNLLQVFFWKDRLVHPWLAAINI